MAEQMGLEFNDRWRDAQISASVRKEVRAVVEEVGVKVVAADLDHGHSTLSQKLEEHERHYLRLDELVAIMRRDSTGRILRTLANALGFEVTKRRELTAAEKLERIDSVLDQNPELAKVIRDKAFGRSV